MRSPDKGSHTRSPPPRQSTFRILIIALIALGWTGVAAAQDQAAPITIEPSAFAALTNMQLDSAFERATSPATRAIALPEPAGDSTMTCQGGASKGDLETCVVTGPDGKGEAPAAPAPH
jgi:hypothetical protein